MPHEEVLKSFYAKLKGVAADSLVRVLDLAKEHRLSYRQLTDLLRSSGLDPMWIGGKAFVCQHEAAAVLGKAS